MRLVLPVAGGVVAEKLGIVKKAEDATEAQRNVFTNWMLEGKLDDSAEAKAFETAMKNPLNAAVKTHLENARTNFQTWQDKEADERMQECIQDQKEKGKSLKEWREHIYNEVVEEFAPIQRLVDAYEEQTGKKLGVSINPMVAFRLLRGQGERVLAMVNGETELAVKALQVRYPSVDWTNFKTIKDIIGSIGAYQNKEKQNDFATYCVACHMLDLHDFNENLEAQKQTLQDDIAALQTQIDNIKDATADEKNTLKKKLKDANDNLAKLNEQEVFTIFEEYIEEEKRALTDEIHNLKAQIDSIQVKKDKKKDLKQQLKDAEDNLKRIEAQKPYTIHDDFSREKCEKYIEKRKKEYGKAQRDLVNYSNVLMQILYDSGYISGKHYKSMVNKWKNYVPMYRVFEENEEIDFGDSLMKFEGSKRDIVNPIESIIHNTGEYIKKAERNKAISVLANFARCDGSGWLAEEVDNRDPNTRTQVTFRENGKVKYIELGDPTIAKAINKMDLDSSNLILKLCHAVTAIARASFTTANPEFLIRNPLRDSADAFLYDGVYPWDIVKGFMHAFRKDATYYDWMTSGAAQSSLVSLDRDYTQEIKESMGENWKSRLLSKKFLPTVIQGLQKMSEFSEYATRIAVYKKRKAEYEQAGMDARDAVLSAALRSRDLIDFGRHGKTGANYNKLVPFANASIQGLDKFYRELIDPKGWKEDTKGRAKTLVRLGLTAILPAILVSLLWGDDDWYKKRCPNWVKDTHWVLPLGKDSVIRIPKGADVGIRFFSNAFQKMMDDNPHKFKEYFAPIVEAMPGIGIAILKPAFEVMVNKNTFTGADIVPKYQEDALPPKMQYGAYTTGFSKWLGEKLDVAPRKIDHLIAGYTGTPGMFIPKAVDVLMGNKQLSTSKEELPISRALLYPKYKNSQTVQDFYDELKEQTQFENEYKATKKRPEGFDPQKLKRMKDTRKKLTELNKKENTTIEDPKLSYDRRKEIIASIYDQRNKLVERALRK